jgi:hypothetical protein
VTDEGLPIEIDGHTYIFRLEDRDVREIERSLSLFVAFHPQNMTYENAARFLQHGLRKRAKDGDRLVYIFPQDETGFDPAFGYVKKFCRQFTGSAGIFVFYGYIDKALITLEWRADPKAKKSEDNQPAKDKQDERDPPKNSVKPTSGITKKSRTGSAD